MIRLLMIPPPETGVRWAKQACHTSQMDRPRMRGEELAVAAPARPSGRDGVMASPPDRRGGGVAAGRCWSCLSARADSLHAVTYDQAEHCPICLRAWTDSQAIGCGPRGRTRLRQKGYCVQLSIYVQNAR